MPNPSWAKVNSWYGTQPPPRRSSSASGTHSQRRIALLRRLLPTFPTSSEGVTNERYKGESWVKTCLVKQMCGRLVGICDCICLGCTLSCTCAGKKSILWTNVVWVGGGDRPGSARIKGVAKSWCGDELSWWINLGSGWIKRGLGVSHLNPWWISEC